MKKMLLALLGTAFAVPMIAQSNLVPLLNDETIVVSSQLPVKEVPSAVIKAINTSFDKNNPATWSKFPYTLKEFGWVYEIGPNVEAPSLYEVRVKTTPGGLMSGFYSDKGNLVRTRQFSKNIPTPRYVLDEIYSGEYNGWKIVGNKELVTLYNENDHTIAKQNFKVTIEKGKERKKLAFNYEASTGKLEARVIR
ncbi:MAG: hypothetical protein WCE64_11905 [Bacteroidales bacterium]